jgi:pimeloyl-ACP methyl ester carboxylesterase
MYPAGQAGLVARRLTLPSGLGVRILECGPNDGVPVVLLHGWGCSLFAFRHNVGALAAASYRVVAPDLKGHGLSDKPTSAAEYTRDAMAMHVLEIMDAARIEAAHLAGHSMGGAIALQVASRAPARVRRLALLAPVGFGQVSLHRLGKWLTPTVMTPALPYLMSRWRHAAVLRFASGPGFRYTPRELDEYWAPTQFPEHARALRQLVHAFLWNPSGEEELRRVRAPVLVMFGTRDRVIQPSTAQEYVGWLPNATLEFVEGAGHLLPEEMAERVNATLLRFFGAPAARRSA